MPVQTYILMFSQKIRAITVRSMAEGSILGHPFGLYYEGGLLLEDNICRDEVKIRKRKPIKCKGFIFK